MSLVQSYVRILIKSVRNHPCIWDSRSRLYRNQEEVEKKWVTVADNVQKSMETYEITVSDVKSTWRNLHKTYITCSATGNKSNFEFFDEMNFLGPYWGWHMKPLESYLSERNSKAKQILGLHFKLNAIMTLILSYFLCFEVNGHCIYMPENLTQNLGLIIVSAVPICMFLPLLMAMPWVTKFYSPTKMFYIWPPIIIYLTTTALNKILLSSMSASYGIFCTGAHLFLLGGISLAGIGAVITASAVKRPFPPSRTQASLNFVISVSWAYIVHVISSQMKEAHWIFQVIPIWVVSNAVLSAFFCYYMWSNSNSRFHNFNENPFVMTTPYSHNPYYVEFKHTPSNQAIEVKEL